MIAFLLESGADPNSTDRHGNGPLWTAAHYGPDGVAMLSLLLRAGANPDQVNKAGRSPQYWREIDPEIDKAFREEGL